MAWKPQRNGQKHMQALGYDHQWPFPAIPCPGILETENVYSKHRFYRQPKNPCLLMENFCLGNTPSLTQIPRVYSFADFNVKALVSQGMGNSIFHTRNVLKPRHAMLFENIRLIARNYWQLCLRKARIFPMSMYSRKPNRSIISYAPYKSPRLIQSNPTILVHARLHRRLLANIQSPVTMGFHNIQFILMINLRVPKPRMHDIVPSFLCKHLRWSWASNISWREASKEYQQ